jgi:FkbM family methyltransferase
LSCDPSSGTPGTSRDSTSVGRPQHPDWGKHRFGRRPLGESSLRAADRRDGMPTPLARRFAFPAGACPVADTCKVPPSSTRGIQRGEAFVTSLKAVVTASARAAGVDLVRFRSVRHAIGRRARLIEALGIDLVIDVGANRGQFALEIRRGGYAARIVSIEPLTAPYRHLARLAAPDERWAVIRSAVGPRAGSATMHVAANDGASSSFLPMLDLHARAAPEARYVADERVDVATLDDLVEPHLRDGGSVFTKLDVQGYELQVLEGASTTLDRSSLVQLEMSLLPLYDTAPTYREVIQFMAQHGYQLIGLEPGFAARSGVLLQADGLFAADQAVRSLQGLRS